MRANVKGQKANAQHFIKQDEKKETTTYEGGEAILLDAKSELFLTSVSSLMEDTFYESRNDRYQRIDELVKEVCHDDEFMVNFIKWLRHDFGMRSVSQIIGVLTVKHRLGNHLNNNADFIDASIGRLDETAEVLAIAMGEFGRSIPSSVKRGVARSLNRLLNERSALKWRGRMGNGSFSLADVINLTHPKFKDANKSALAKFILDSAYGNETDLSKLPIVSAREKFLSLDKDDALWALMSHKGEEIMRDGAIDHNVIASKLEGKIPAELWEKIIPGMGYMALRMALNNIASSGIDEETIKMICDRISNEEEVKKSRQFPISFLMAYKNSPLAFAPALEKAMNHSLSNVPKFSGRTLIMVDRSGSMAERTSSRAMSSLCDVANVFASALAIRAENASVVAYNTENSYIDFDAKDVLRGASLIPEPRWGTKTLYCLYSALQNLGEFDRIIIITDEMSSAGNLYKLGESVGDTPLYIWNVAGYKAHVKLPGRSYYFGGLNDGAFKAMEIIDQGYNTKFPWEK